MSEKPKLTRTSMQLKFSKTPWECLIIRPCYCQGSTAVPTLSPHWSLFGLLIGMKRLFFTAWISLMNRRLGRRKLMMFAVVGQGCCMAILAGTVWDGGHAAGLVATVMLFMFNFFFAVGLLAIPWLCMWRRSKSFPTAGRLLIKRTTVPAEYSPLAIRTQSAALATATNCKEFSAPAWFTC